MHLEELKELNIKLFNTIPIAQTMRALAFEERVYAKIREMSFKGESSAFLPTKEFNVCSAYEFNELVSHISSLLLPYFKLVNLNTQVRIDAIKI